MPTDSPYFTATPTFAQRADNYNALHHNIYRPPLTPGTPFSASPDYTLSTLAPDQDLSAARKRLRADSNVAIATPAQSTFSSRLDRDRYSDIWENDVSARATSPAPLANARYALSGGFDTPTLAAAAYYDQPGHAVEFDFRQRWDSGADSPPDAYVAGGPLARERNGHGRIDSGDYDEQPQTNGWGTFVYGLASTVAGKIFNFCRGGAILGFHAGQGRGYNLARPLQVNQDGQGDAYRQANLRTGIPAPTRQYPRAQDFDGDFEQDNTPVRPPLRPRPSKRQHTDTGKGWVFVEGNLDAFDDDSVRINDRKVSNPLLSTTQPTASRANARRSLVPVSRRISSNVVPTTASHQSPPANCPKPLLDPLPVVSSRQRSASTASTRLSHRHGHYASHSPRPSTANGAPLTSAAIKYIAKKDKQDKVADKSMRKMNRQLQDLIRQGQAALGTRVEIAHDQIDQGSEDGDAEAWEDAGADADFVMW